MVDISLVVGLVFVVYFCVRTVWKLWQSRRSTKKHPLLTRAWSNNTPWRRRPPIPPVLPHYPRPKIKEAIQDAERRAAWMAKYVQADNQVTDGLTGTTYVPYAIGGSTIDEYSNKTWKMFPHKWIPLVGHFVTIYPGTPETPGTSILVDPMDTILQIMQKTNLPYNKVLVYDQKRLEYLNWTLLKYGVPDNRKVVLTVEELVLGSDSDSDNSDSDSGSDSNSDSNSDSDVYVEDLRL